MAAERAAYGLPTDDATLRAVAAQVGEAALEWGIPMTDDEAARLDLQQRAVVANTAAEVIVPAVEKLPTYAGIFQDQRGGGKIVVLFTKDDPILRSELSSLLDDAYLEFRVVQHSQTELIAARDQAVDVWASLREVALRSVGIDYSLNSLRLGVSQADLSNASSVLSDIEVELRVPAVLVARPDDDGTVQACDDREHCANPFRHGVVIRADSTDGPRCTMGFHIGLPNGDHQFLSAGHCGLTSTNWYHRGITGSGFVGSVTASEYGVLDPSVDLMRVQMANNHSNFRVYGIVRNVQGRSNPVQEETLCASLGRTDAIDCGIVNDADIVYNDTNGEHVVQAFDMDFISTQGGDSGSPIYRALSGTNALAIGSHSTAGGLASKLGAALTEWGAGVVIEP